MNQRGLVFMASLEVIQSKGHLQICKPLEELTCANVCTKLLRSYYFRDDEAAHGMLKDISTAPQNLLVDGCEIRHILSRLNPWLSQEID
jgi:hypothetical protein